MKTSQILSILQKKLELIRLVFWLLMLQPMLSTGQNCGMIKKQVKLNCPVIDLTKFKDVIESLINSHSNDFKTNFIAESPDKIRRFYHYYDAYYGESRFPGR